jgi:type I restriction enzyme S subunit
MDLTKSKEFIETGILATPKKPYDWVVRRISHLCVVGRGRVISNEDIAQNPGIYPVYSSQTENNGELGKIATYDFDGDYLTWTTDGANAGTVFRRSGCFSCTNVCGTLKIKNNLEVDIDFLNYALSVQTKFFVRKDINPKLMNDVMAGIKVILPSIKLQKTLANYLDHETAKIDTLISAKERLLDLLTEKRQSLITNVITCGLNPDVPMRYSGVEWIGNIPKHWEVVKVKYVAQVGNGSTPLRDNKAYWENGKFPWLTSTVVNDDVIGKPTEFVTEIALQECHLPIVQDGSVLVAITGEGKTRGKASLLSYPTTINQHPAFICPQANLLIPEFLQLFLSSSYEILRMISEGTGSTKGALTCEQLSEFVLPLPPLIEQKQIISSLNKSKINIDKLIKVTVKIIELLGERRTALITAAVTGQIRIEK